MKVEIKDDDLARAARIGDLGAFRTLVERHRGRIFSLALRMAGNRAEAEDMAQEAFLRIYRGLGSFRGESAFSTWMVRVALNTFNRHLRRVPRMQPLPPETLEDRSGSTGPGRITGAGSGASSGANPESSFLDSETAAEVRRKVAELPEPFRDAVTMFYFEDRSLEEAASELGVSTGTMKSRLFRAREMLLRGWRSSP
jgi:RNA polymerase sigma-70 factor (ECF subfamily)